jgi:hypothetical protein
MAGRELLFPHDDEAAQAKQRQTEAKFTVTTLPLMPSQKQAVQWMLSMRSRGLNMVFADPSPTAAKLGGGQGDDAYVSHFRGGKTVATIAFLAIMASPKPPLAGESGGFPPANNSSPRSEPSSSSTAAVEPAADVHVHPPSLVLVPEGAMLQWICEVRRFCPQLNLLVVGSDGRRYADTASKSKAAAASPALFSGCPDDVHFVNVPAEQGPSLATSNFAKAYDTANVVLCTYADLHRCQLVLRERVWSLLVVDSVGWNRAEAFNDHSSQAQTWHLLLDIPCVTRLMLASCTMPHDTSICHRWLQFVLPSLETSCARLGHAETQILAAAANAVSNVNVETVGASGQTRLKDILKPFFFRRVCTKALDEEAALEGGLVRRDGSTFVREGIRQEVVVCEMTLVQSQAYVEYLQQREAETLMAGGDAGGVLALLLQLRRLCNIGSLKSLCLPDEEAIARADTPGHSARPARLTYRQMTVQWMSDFLRSATFQLRQGQNRPSPGSASSPTTPQSPPHHPGEGIIPVPGKLLALVQLVSVLHANGKKVVVLAQMDDLLPFLGFILENLAVEEDGPSDVAATKAAPGTTVRCAVVDGSKSSLEQQAEIARFNCDPNIHVLVMSTRSMFGGSAGLCMYGRHFVRLVESELETIGKHADAHPCCAQIRGADGKLTKNHTVAAGASNPKSELTNAPPSETEVQQADAKARMTREHIGRLANLGANATATMLQACSLGVDPTAADAVVVYDGDWDVVALKQLRLRLSRLCLNRKLDMYCLCTKGSVEEAFYESNENISQVREATPLLPSVSSVASTGYLDSIPGAATNLSLAPDVSTLDQLEHLAANTILHRWHFATNVL